MDGDIAFVLTSLDWPCLCGSNNMHFDLIWLWTDLRLGRMTYLTWFDLAKYNAYFIWFRLMRGFKWFKLFCSIFTCSDVMAEKLNLHVIPMTACDGMFLTSGDLKCDLTKKWFKYFRWRSGWATQRRLPFFSTYRGSRDLRGGAGTRPPSSIRRWLRPPSMRVLRGPWLSEWALWAKTVPTNHDGSLT